MNVSNTDISGYAGIADNAGKTGNAAKTGNAGNWASGSEPT